MLVTLYINDTIFHTNGIATSVQDMSREKQSEHIQPNSTDCKYVKIRCILAFCSVSLSFYPSETKSAHSINVFYWQF